MRAVLISPWMASIFLTLIPLNVFATDLNLNTHVEKFYCEIFDLGSRADALGVSGTILAVGNQKIELQKNWAIDFQLCEGLLLTAEAALRNDPPFATVALQHPRRNLDVVEKSKQLLNRLPATADEPYRGRQISIGYFGARKDVASGALAYCKKSVVNEQRFANPADVYTWHRRASKVEDKIKRLPATNPSWTIRRWNRPGDEPKAGPQTATRITRNLPPLEVVPEPRNQGDSGVPRQSRNAH